MHKSAQAEWARQRRDSVRSVLWWALPLCAVCGFAAAVITGRAYFGWGFAVLALLAMVDVARTKPGRLGEAGARARGEAATAKALKPLRFLGYRLLNDRRLPPNSTAGAPAVDVEHLLIGPAGVFLLDSKNWESGPKVQFADKNLWRGLENQKPALDRVAAEAKTLQAAAAALLPAGVTVQPAMILHLKELQPMPRYFNGILLMLPHQVEPTVRGMRQVMTGTQAATLAAALDRILAPRTGDRSAVG